jgi:polysaccharide export outer membrane protein
VRRIFSIVLTCALLAGALAAPSTGQEGYRIGPKDLLDIRVFEEPTLNIQRRVPDDGVIELPLVGEMQVSGLTADQAAAAIKAALEESYLQRATVTVLVTEFRSRPISVIGAVKKPGNLELAGSWTLLETLTEAGGLQDNHGDVIHVLRRAPNGLSDQLAIDIDRLLLEADPSVNIPIFANDVINVSAEVELTVFCVGEVEQPGALVFKSTERMTVLAAIARAGGLTRRASRKILIKRDGPGGEPLEFEVGYKEVIAGKEPDFRLRDGDLIVVKESFF